MLTARMRKLITACAGKNKRTARMLANTRKDHSIPLYKLGHLTFKAKKKIYFVKLGHFSYFLSLNFDVNFMILKLPDTRFLRLEKLIYLIKKHLKIQSLLSGYWLLVQKIVYFQNQV